MTSIAGSNSGGFSLLELILVLMVLALSSFIVLPNIERRLQERTIRSSALGLAAVARSLRSRALDQGVPQTLIVNVAQNSYGSSRDDDVRLPEDVKFSSVTGGEMIDQTVRQFVFFPNGSSEGGTIGLSGGAHGSSYELRFEPLTGRVEVERDQNQTP